MLNFRIYQYPNVCFIISHFDGREYGDVFWYDSYYQFMFKHIRGISPMDAGLLMLPGALLMAIMSPLTGKLFDKFGGRILAIIGLAITVVTTYLFSQLTFRYNLYTLINFIFSTNVWDVDGYDASFDKWLKSIANTLLSTWYSDEQYIKSSIWCNWYGTVGHHHVKSYENLFY